MSTVSLSGLSVVLVDPSDEDAIQQWYELRCAVVAADQPDDPPPCWVHELGSFRHPWPGEVRTIWLARVAGSVVGGCVLVLPMLDNLRKRTAASWWRPSAGGTASVDPCSLTYAP